MSQHCNFCSSGSASDLTVQLLNHNLSLHQVMVGFADPCTLPEHPGWPLRNILAFLSFHRYVIFNSFHDLKNACTYTFCSY